MDIDEDKHASKHKRSREKGDREHRKKRHRSDKESSHKRKDKSQHENTRIFDDDANDEDMWLEKNIDMDGEQPLATDIPTAESLAIKSRAVMLPTDPPLPPPVASETPATALKREAWMLEPPATSTISLSSAHTSERQRQMEESLTEDYGEPSADVRTTTGGVDFFSALGTERKKKPAPKLEEPKISHKELNTALKEGKSLDEYPTSAPNAVIPGGPGSAWRMMKLRRVYETAEEEGRPVDEVALERFSSLEEFEEAREERRILDEREGRRSGKAPAGKGKAREVEPVKGFLFNDLPGSHASSRSSSFRRPELGESGRSVPSTPSPAEQLAGAPRGRPSAMRLPDQGGIGSPLAQAHTPVPSVMVPTPHIMNKKRALSPSSLNKLQARVLRAKLMNTPDAAALEREYEMELKRANGEGPEGDEGERTRVEVLPTLDAQGRLYDVGQGRNDAPLPLGNRKKKEKVETHDPKTGELIRVNADDDDITLGEMLRQERFGAGAADQKNLNAQFARAIATDGGFANNLDYMDDNAERLARQKMRSDAMKRQFAINDYKRTQKVLATCQFCFGEDDSPPKAAVITMGTRVYLACTQHEPLVEGHCLIVPIQHHLTMLEGDDDVWDEVRNFMKSLMQMFAEEDKGVLFYETVISLKKQRHTCIECVPLPWDQYDIIPGYFKESIMMSELEWSQHQKLIDFSKRPGGFRRAMVPNLPYFMVQFDYKGEKGYGHVIEGVDDAAAADDPDAAIDEGEKGGGDFPWYFAGEIIGNLLDLEPRLWRHPRRIDAHRNKDRIAKFKRKYDNFDWTPMIGKS